MINKKHYTKRGEHPEDRIFKDKEYITRLNKHIDDIYEKLCLDLNLNEDGKDAIFDFIFNFGYEDYCFEEYLTNHGWNYSDLVDPVKPKPWKTFPRN